MYKWSSIFRFPSLQRLPHCTDIVFPVTYSVAFSRDGVFAALGDLVLKPPQLQLFAQFCAFLRNQVTPTPIPVSDIFSLRRSQAYPNKSLNSQKHPPA